MTVENLIELGVDKDIAEKVTEYIRVQTDDLKTVHKNELEALRDELDRLLISTETEKAIEKASVLSKRAVYSLLDFDKISVKNGVVYGVSEELDRVRREYGILFRETAVPRVVSSATDSVAAENAVMRGVMGI